jgi:tetratricopeptide (TPR) repeat protein
MQLIPEAPAPSPKTIASIQEASALLRTGADAARGRPMLFDAVEKAVTTDLTDSLVSAVAENIAYTGLTAVFEDALKDTKNNSNEADWIRYNLARLHLLRARVLRGEPKQSALRTAQRVATPLGTNVRNFELQGDIAVERGDLEAASAFYRRTIAYAGSAVLSFYKIGLAYQKNNRPSETEVAFNDALRADARSSSGGKAYKHLIYQALGSLFFEQQRKPEAAKMLLASVKVQIDNERPFALRVGLAKALLA